MNAGLTMRPAPLFCGLSHDAQLAGNCGSGRRALGGSLHASSRRWTRRSPVDSGGLPSYAYVTEMVEDKNTSIRGCVSSFLARARKRPRRDGGQRAVRAASQNPPAEELQSTAKKRPPPSNDKNEGTCRPGHGRNAPTLTRRHADRRAASVAPGGHSARCSQAPSTTRLRRGGADIGQPRWRRRSISCTNCVATCAAGVHAPAPGEAGFKSMMPRPAA